MRVVIEEIVSSHPSKQPITYRRRTVCIAECPDVLFLSADTGHELTIGEGTPNSPRRQVVIAACRVALISNYNVNVIGLILDVISPELMHALDHDNAMPKDYEAFCKQEGIAP